MIEAETIDAASTIRLLEALEMLYPLLAVIHVFLDNAAIITPGLCKIGWPSLAAKAAFHPGLLPAFEPDRAAVGRDAQHVTHNKCYATSRIRGGAQFPTQESPKKLAGLCDSVTDNFRVINPKDFRFGVNRIFNKLPIKLNLMPEFFHLLGRAKIR